MVSGDLRSFQGSRGQADFRHREILASSKETTLIVCECAGLTDGQVRNLIRQGWNSLALLQEATGIGTDCGTCFPELLRLLSEELPATSAPPSDSPNPNQA